jgi:nucleoside-diphosphate-sugar epimerase
MHALVTGGGGFLGRRIVELLRDQGHSVRFLARGAYPEVEATGATGLQVDLQDKEAVSQAVEGVDIVFHVAARAGFFGPLSDYWGPNVDGTRHILDAMEDHGVTRLVYTSTPSVIGYEHDVEDGGNDLPYAGKHLSPYPESKAAAEQLVLESNRPGLATVSLRPHLIYGPRDTNLMPRVFDRARRGRLRIIGDGTAMVDTTYIDNAAWAHLDAARALTGSTAPCAGNAYFISDDQPVVLWDWVNTLLTELEIPLVNRKIPYSVARPLAGVLEGAWRMLGLKGEPPLTPFVVDGFARSHWFNMAPAKRDFGYYIRVSPEDALKRTVGWFQKADADESPAV